jgi:hypothetical protein
MDILAGRLPIDARLHRAPADVVLHSVGFIKFLYCCGLIIVEAGAVRPPLRAVDPRCFQLASNWGIITFATAQK